MGRERAKNLHRQRQHCNLLLKRAVVPSCRPKHSICLQALAARPLRAKNKQLRPRHRGSIAFVVSIAFVIFAMVAAVYTYKQATAFRRSLKYLKGISGWLFSATRHATAPNTTALEYFTATRSGSRVIDCFKAQTAAKTLSAVVGYPLSSNSPTAFARFLADACLDVISRSAILVGR